MDGQTGGLKAGSYNEDCETDIEWVRRITSRCRRAMEKGQADDASDFGGTLPILVAPKLAY